MSKQYALVEVRFCKDGKHCRKDCGQAHPDVGLCQCGLTSDFWASEREEYGDRYLRTDTCKRLVAAAEVACKGGKA